MGRGTLTFNPSLLPLSPVFFKVKAVTVLNMVRQMQEEIRRLNRKIREENELIKVKSKKCSFLLKLFLFRS